MPRTTLVDRLLLLVARAMHHKCTYQRRPACMNNTTCICDHHDLDYFDEVLAEEADHLMRPAIRFLIWSFVKIAHSACPKLLFTGRHT